MLYLVLKYLVAIGLYAFQKKISVRGRENIPRNKPVLFLPNHQNALIDVLLIAINCKRKPYFLTRSDVFKNTFLKRFFSYLHMIPVYRIRDGRDTLEQNHKIFDACAQLLQKGNAIVMFPETNHNLKRRIRPLSKGFTRVLFKALEDAGELDVQIVPVGLNYRHAESFPDAAAVYYGKPIAVQELYDQEDLVGSALRLRDIVATRLKELTTHVTPETEYDAIIKYLTDIDMDFLDPRATNYRVKNWDSNIEVMGETKKSKPVMATLVRPVFLLMNFPVVILWKFVVKPKVRQPEFFGTMRFATALVGFVIFLPCLFALLYISFNLGAALMFIVCLVLFNWIYVKAS